MKNVVRSPLSVVVPAWNGLELTRACIDSLEACAPDEVIVVDNGSRDGTAEWLAEQAAHRPWLRVVTHETNRGFAAGCNAGIAAARGDFVVILNNDTVAPPSLLGRLLGTWRRVPRVGLVGAVSDFVKGRQHVPLDEPEGTNVDDLAARVARDAHGAIEEVKNLAGLCLLGSRDFFEEVGAFDESYGIGNFEDDDLCLRARLAGYRLVIARDAFVHHVGNATFTALGVPYRDQFHEQELLHRAKWQDHPLFEIEDLDEAGGEDRVAPIERFLREIDPGTPAFVWAQRAYAIALDDAERYADALPHWRAFTDHHPLDNEAVGHYAFALLLAGREREGREQLARLLSSCWVDAVCGASVLTKFARWCREHGKIEEAEEHLETAIALVDDFVPAWNTKAVWLLEAERWREAEACLLPFRDRGDGDVLTNLGIALYRQGNVGESIAAFREGEAIAGSQSAAANNLRAVLDAHA